MKEAYTTKEVNAAIVCIMQRLLSIQDKNASMFVADVAGKPVIHTRIQSLFNMRFSDELEKTIYELVMMHATKAEKLGPGGFNRYLELLLEKFGVSRRGNHYTKIESPCVATSDDINAIIEAYAYTNGTRIACMLRNALELAGFAGRIIIEKTSSSTPSVELVRGYTFDLQQILPIDVSFLRPRVICIDGYVENVSEIHHLLEAASSAKEPCILFLRGISEDVKHTLKVNYDRGSLRVIPIGVRFDLEGMNTLVDLSIVSGCDLVSSLKGDLISSIKFEDLPCVEQVTAFKNRIVINNFSTHKRVKKHITELRTRRQEEKTCDKEKLLDARIKSLSPNHVVIRLVDDKDFVINSQAIDYALRAVRSAIDYGVTKNGSPVTTEIAARLHVDKCFETLSNVGAYVTKS